MVEQHHPRLRVHLPARLFPHAPHRVRKQLRGRAERRAVGPALEQALAKHLGEHAVAALFEGQLAARDGRHRPDRGVQQLALRKHGAAGPHRGAVQRLLVPAPSAPHERAPVAAVEYPNLLIRANVLGEVVQAVHPERRRAPMVAVIPVRSDPAAARLFVLHAVAHVPEKELRHLLPFEHGDGVFEGGLDAAARARRVDERDDEVKPDLLQRLFVEAQVGHGKVEVAQPVDVAVVVVGAQQRDAAPHDRGEGDRPGDVGDGERVGGGAAAGGGMLLASGAARRRRGGHFLEPLQRARELFAREFLV